MSAAKYTIRDLRREFPDDDTCLTYLFNARFPDGVTCPNYCDCKSCTGNGGKNVPVEKQKLTESSGTDTRCPCEVWLAVYRELGNYTFYSIDRPLAICESCKLHVDGHGPWCQPCLTPGAIVHDRWGWVYEVRSIDNGLVTLIHSSDRYICKIEQALEWYTEVKFMRIPTDPDISYGVGRIRAIKEVSIQQAGIVYIEGVGKSGMILNGGLVISPAAMDAIARQWIDYRQTGHLADIITALLAIEEDESSECLWCLEPKDDHDPVCPAERARKVLGS